jgi:hypothetical protein
MYNSIEEAMLGLSVWKKYRKKEKSPLEKNLAYKPTYEADYYREAVFYRFIELTEASFELYKQGHLISSVILARSAQETVSVLWYINEKLKYVVKEKDLTHFSKTMYKLILGYKGDDLFPEKVNVLTMIQCVDKTLEGRFSELYDTLSEYAHPNHSGTMAVYAKTDIDNLSVTFGKYQRSEEHLRSMIESALNLNISLLDHIQETYEEYINQVLDICIDLHQSGSLKEQISRDAVET